MNSSAGSGGEMEEDAPLTHLSGWSAKQAAGSTGTPAAGKEKQHQVAAGSSAHSQLPCCFLSPSLCCTDTC
ncbi:unnamed protein product [Eretmochelys imbricata]